MTDPAERSVNPVDVFRASVRQFVQSIEMLPESLWLSKIVNWTPRDIVAHLIGWNVYVRDGCDLMLAGKSPTYLSDRENDYRRVNATSVEHYSARDKRTLLLELEVSSRELEQYLTRLDLAAWDADTGVQIRGRPVTIRNSIRALARDFDNHRHRIEQWRSSIQSR